MAMLCKGVPRAIVLLVAAVFFFVPPETLARGPNLCLWRHLFHLAACPSCGTTRALAAFFHGRFREAIAFNYNVIATAPSLLLMLAKDSREFVQRLLARGVEKN